MFHMLRALMLVSMLGSSVAVRVPPPMMQADPRGANPVLGVASMGMGLLKPVFKAETAVQAAVTNFGSYDVEAIRAEISDISKRAPAVVLTYGLSPFSAECVAVLESTGCNFDIVPLGPEWFLLGARGSAIRAELGNMYGQTSLPHVWIGGEWVGGLYSGEPGLAKLVESGELAQRLKKAKAL